MMPDDWKDRIGDVDAIFFGAVGWPDTVPDHISLWQSLIQFRREYDQYVNLRPVRLMPGVPCPLAGRKPGDIDFVVVRENTEGEYSSVEIGRAHVRTPVTNAHLVCRLLLEKINKSRLISTPPSYMIYVIHQKHNQTHHT